MLSARWVIKADFFGPSSQILFGFNLSGGRAEGRAPNSNERGVGADPFRNMAKKKLCKVEAKSLLKLLENLVLTGGANQLHASSCKAGHSGIIIKVI